MHITRQDLKRGRNVFTPQELEERRTLGNPDVPDAVKDALIARSIQEVQLTWTELDRMRALYRCNSVPAAGDVIPTIREFFILRRTRRND